MTKTSPHHIRAELENRLLHALSCEWEARLMILPPACRDNMKKPVFRLSGMTRRLGAWVRSRREILISRDFVLNHPWDSVREVLFHEMAHQMADERMGGGNDFPHGPVFQKACSLLHANPRASGTFAPLHDRVGRKDCSEEDRILLRIRKLMALAESANPHEAEAAMLKAHELIRRHHIDLIKTETRRRYESVFVGKPGLRFFREDYALGLLLQDYYCVEAMWVSAYVMDRGKMGRVLEISGTPRNIQMAGYVYDFVSRYIDSQWKRCSRDKKLTRYRKTDFALGVIEGFRGKLNTSASSGDAASNGRELMTVQDHLLEKYMKYRYPYRRTLRKNAVRYDPEIRSQGVEAGKRLVIHEGISEKGNQTEFLLPN